MGRKKKALVERMLAGEFVVSVQIDPPDKEEVADFKAKLKALKNAGVKLLDINSSRRISDDSIHLAAEIRRMGFEVIPHVTTRDSSINGLLNQIRAAARWNKVENFLIITGDPYEPEKAIFPSKGVFQADAVGALELLNKYLRKCDEGDLRVNFAAAVNHNEPDISLEGERLIQKQINGTDFFMSQPVFCESEAKKLFGFYNAYSTRPLMMGIWPLVSKRTILAIKRGNIVGVVLSDEVYSEAEPFLDDEEALTDWGLGKAQKLIELIRHEGYAQGVYIVAPSRNPLLLLDILPKIL